MITVTRRPPAGRSPRVLIIAGVVALGLATGFWTRELLRPRHAHTRRAAAPVATATPQPMGPPTLLVGGSEAVPVIMYHDVMPRREVWFDLTTDEFAAQLQLLADAGAHPVSLKDLYEHLNTGRPLPTRPVVLTFDDATLGHFTQVLPLLKKHRFPAVFFVQTAFVGKRTGKDHMTWEQLRQTEASGLVEVESHTVTHPEDITTLSDYDLAQEMQASRSELETRLGHPIRFLAYPSGNCDARVAEAALQAGYLAAVTMDRGWAAAPAQSYYLPRLTPKRVDEVVAAWRGEAPIGPPLPRLITCANTPLERGTFKDGPYEVEWIAGGDLGTVSLPTRQTVGEMAWEANVQAALNGTFFADARIQSTGSAMIGPTLSRADNSYHPGEPSHDEPLSGRPTILIGNARCLVLPYAPHLGHSREVLESLMPDVRDAFVAGGWIVHHGRAVPREIQQKWNVESAAEQRHRAFLGIDKRRRYLLGAIGESISTLDLTPILEKMGLEEAWLMDSGFSTSLVWQNRILVSGHSRDDIPSRPVPHALFLHGNPAPTALPPPEGTRLAGGPGAVTTEEALAADGGAPPARTGQRRHRRRRR